MKQMIVHKIIDTEKKCIPEIFLEKGKIYTFLNPVSYLVALKNRELFYKFDGIFADGLGLVYSIWIFYFRKVTRKSFDMVGIAPALFSYANDMQKSIYFIGAEQNEIEKATNIFHAYYPNMNIVGYRNGFFDDELEIEKEIKNVAAIQPDFLIVGMGILKQEEMLVRMRDAGFNGVGFSCGGFIHQTSINKINYYPAWINRLNFRFFYRMLKEKHTRKRYFSAFIYFPVRFFKERITGK